MLRLNLQAAMKKSKYKTPKPKGVYIFFGDAADWFFLAIYVMLNSFSAVSSGFPPQSSQSSSCSRFDGLKTLYFLPSRYFTGADAAFAEARQTLKSLFAAEAISAFLSHIFCGTEFNVYADNSASFFKEVNLCSAP